VVSRFEGNGTLDESFGERGSVVFDVESIFAPRGGRELPDPDPLPVRSADEGDAGGEVVRRVALPVSAIPFLAGVGRGELGRLLGTESDEVLLGVAGTDLFAG
jgi:hypothetical protein